MFVFCSYNTSILDLATFVRTNRALPYADLIYITQVTHASTAQQAECQIQVTEVLGSMLTGFFLFSHSKACRAKYGHYCQIRLIFKISFVCTVE